MKSGFRARRRIRLALLLMTIGFALSCTRMPTAPRVSILVEGRISGQLDEPLEGAWLWFTSTEAGGLRWEYARTDSLGRYSAELFAGTYSVSVEPPAGYATPSHDARVTFSSSNRRYDFRFHGFRVTGRVTGPTGAPIDSGQVVASNSDPSFGSARAALKGGAFSLLLPPGTYSVYATDAEYWSGLPGRAIGGVPISADTTIDIELGGIAVSGQVFGPDGLPMGNVRARADWVSGVYTAADGSYRFYVPTGTYRIWFEPPSPFYIFPRVTDPMMISDPISVDCDLSGVEWTGTVRRSGTGESLAGITLLVRQVDDEVRRGAAIKSGSQGEFRFILERDRSYDLETYTPGTSGPVPRLQGVAATADTTFEILIP